MPPVLSVLIPTLDFPEVDDVVTALLHQTADPSSYEVIVSDCHRGIWKERVARAAAKRPEVTVKYIQRERGILARTKALNTAIEHATGNLIVFLSGDFTVEPPFVGLHLDFHAHRPAAHIAAVAPGKFIPSQGDTRFVTWLEKDGRIFGNKGTTGDANGFFYVGNASLKREFLDRVGPMDEDFPYEAFDDHEYGVRLRAAGLQSFYLPDALAWHAHAHAPDLAERIVVNHRAGESAAIFERKYEGPHGWTPSCLRHPLRLELDALSWGVRYLIRRRDEDLGNYYASRMDAAFVRGWRAERARGL